MQEDVEQGVLVILDYAWGLFGLIVSVVTAHSVMRLVEMLAPRTAFSSRSQLTSIKFWPFYLASLALTALLLKLTFENSQLFPLIKIDGETLYAASGLGPFNYVLWPIVNLTILDFFHYWKHRAQHKFFWRFHAVHHSIEELSAINSYHHWTDPIFGTFLAAFPMAVLIGMDTPTFVVLAFLMWLQGAFIHSNTRIHLGIFNRIFVDNRLHRIHHSIEERHFDKNFGERSSIWDQLFGTAYFPERDEWPDTGVSGLPERRRLTDYIWCPSQVQELGFKGPQESVTKPLADQA
ncbi:sterol desaturase family protein [Sphingomonas sp. LY29]|uniref:sterol desaturase family protein n=1 Tax=Sphingomonas sp. LY29 TaxID=3095341 RepID=UPI002D76A484|nr:sterol desaturase family protein [Sphingomonas sp. LY29]WRP26359.1 sterol desaturase family protein [Sphingomonas sp. LY29]